MSKLKRSGLVCAGLVFCSIQAFSVWAADKKNDLLEETKRQLDLKAQKLEGEVNDSLAEAEKLSKTEPAKAAQTLRRTLLLVSDDLSMTASKRDGLLKSLREKIQKYEGDADRKVFEKPADPKPTPKQDDRKRDDDRVQRELDAIRAMRSAGRSADADRRMSDLARLYPDNPAIKAQGLIGGMRDRLADADALKRERDEKFTRVGNENLKTASIPVNDIDFPSDWATRVKKRSSQPPMTKKEKAIMDALQTQIQVEFTKAPLEEILDNLSKKLNVPIMVDKAMLEAVGAAGDTPVTVVGRDVSLRTVLHKILGEVGLTYIVEEETIKVVTPDVAKNRLVIRSYNIMDLVWVGNSPFVGPLGTQLQLAQNIQSLISMIVTTIEPDSWEINGTGGRGTIAFYGPTMSLIIKQSAELHNVMSNGYK